MSRPTPDERRERIRLQLRRRLWVRRGVLAICLLLGLSIVLDHARGLIRAPAAGGDDWAEFERRTWAVEQIIEGDLITIAGPGGPTRVRLVGIDAPDLDPRDGPMYWSDKSREQLARRLQDKQVFLRLEPTHTRDSDGALLAHVYVGDDEHLNAVMIRDGHAYADRRVPHSMLNQFEMDEMAARKRKIGLWKAIEEEQMPPWRRQWLAELREQQARETRKRR